MPSPVPTPVIFHGKHCLLISHVIIIFIIILMIHCMSSTVLCMKRAKNICFCFYTPAGGQSPPAGVS